MKKVKVTVSGMPITSISAPLTMGTHGPMMMDIKNIFKCVVSGAKVVEVLENGTEVVLTLANYDSDNSVPKAVAPTESLPKVAPVEEAAEEVEEVQEESTDEVADPVEPAVVQEEPPVVEATVEEPVVTEEVTAAEEPQSPEHWLPPQRENTVQRNNTNNSRNGKKRK